MTENYTQNVEMEVSSKTKAMQWIGIAAVLFSLGFLMLTIFLKWYFVFAFIAILAIGVVYLHFYNTTAKEYIYDYSAVRLVISKKDLLGKVRRMLSLMLDDVVSCGLMEGFCDDGDVLACNAAHKCGVYQIIYKEDGKTRRLLFMPDDYMLALLKNALSGKFCFEESEKAYE